VRAALVLLVPWFFGCALSAAEARDDREPAGPGVCEFKLAAEGDIGPAPDGQCWRVRSALNARVTTMDVEDPCGAEVSTCLVLPPGRGDVRIWGAPGYDGPAAYTDPVACDVRCPNE
jgi:hypothetical protein